MLKVRLKARVIERRASPLARRPLKTRIKHRSEYSTVASDLRLHQWQQGSYLNLPHATRKKYAKRSKKVRI